MFWKICRWSENFSKNPSNSIDFTENYYYNDSTVGLLYGVRSMKSLYVLIFGLLTAIAVAEPLAPRLPVQDILPAEPFRGSTEELEGLAKILDSRPPVDSTTVRGQIRVGGDEPTGIMSSPPPPARGPVEDPIEPRLVGNSEMSDSEPQNFGMTSAPNSTKAGPSGTGSLTDPLGYGTLIAATVIMAMGLVWMVFIDYDYHQRWVQAMTMQNERYLGGSSFDVDLEDTFGSPAAFSDSYGLPRQSI